MHSEGDEQAIVREVARFAEVWNRGDARAAAGFFTEDGVRVGAAGDVAQGRAELVVAYERLLCGPFSGASVELHGDKVRLLTPELALWRGGMTIRLPAGAPPLEGHVVQVMKKVDGRWLVLEAHAALHPPPRG